MIQQIETVRPKFVVYVNVSTSWLIQPDADLTIADWFLDYVDRHYSRVGLIESLEPHETNYYWDGEQMGRTPKSSLWLTVYERSEG
jgi:hypothetical protein